jgi:protein TonB
LLLCAGETKRITQSQAMEAVTSKVPPEYPAIARQLKLEGAVEVDLVIGENGTVESATPVTGNPVLTRPAVDALKRWKFKPFQENGSAVKAQVVMTVSFTK